MQNITKKYDKLASYFSQLPDYSIRCGTDYIALKEAPALLAQVSPLKNILDLGCGTGLATRFLKSVSPNACVIGADINQKMLAEAKLADPTGIYLHVDKSLSTFLENSFDAIVCSFVVHENENAEELNQFFAAIYRMLRPGGITMMWDPHENLYHGNWATIEVLDKGEKKDGDNYTVKLQPAGAVVAGTHWSSQTIAKIASANGFVNSNVQLPIATDNEYPWQDEKIKAPYYIFSAYKG